MNKNKLQKLVCSALLAVTVIAPNNDILPAEAAEQADNKTVAQEAGEQNKDMQTGKADKATVKELLSQVKELQEQLDDSHEAQERIMEALDDIQFKNQEYDSFLSGISGDYYGDVPVGPIRGVASTNKYLVYPGGDSGTPGYTQDAINAQGNSTMVFAYAPNQLYKIYCRRGYLTDLAFHKGETIRYVGGGDTAGWAVSTTTVDGVPHLYIKPIVEVSTTNLIVTTDKHSYQLIVNSSGWYNPMVTWTYEAENLMQSMAAQQKDERLVNGHFDAGSLENLDFGYKIKGGEKEHQPVMVFSDGEQTYMQFAHPLRKKLPLFIREPGRKGLSLVNYRNKGNYLIVEKVFDQAQLRISDNEIITIRHK